MASRVVIHAGKVEGIVDRVARPGSEAAAKFMADQARSNVQSSRVRSAIGHQSGKDARGWYARAGMPANVQNTAAFIWYFHEFRTGRGQPGQPFLRPSLWNNTGTIARMMTGGRGML